MRSKLLTIMALAIQDADNRRWPKGYAAIVNNDDIGDWEVWLADHVLIAMAEHGFNIVFDPLTAVTDMKTWPQDVRTENGLKD